MLPTDIRTGINQSVTTGFLLANWCCGNKWDKVRKGVFHQHMWGSRKDRDDWSLCEEARLRTTNRWHLLGLLFVEQLGGKSTGALCDMKRLKNTPFSKVEQAKKIKDRLFPLKGLHWEAEGRGYCWRAWLKGMGNHTSPWNDLHWKHRFKHF